MAQEFYYLDGKERKGPLMKNTLLIILMLFNAFAYSQTNNTFNSSNVKSISDNIKVLEPDNRLIVEIDCPNNDNNKVIMNMVNDRLGFSGFIDDTVNKEYIRLRFILKVEEERLNLDKIIDEDANMLYAKKKIYYLVFTDGFIVEVSQKEAEYYSNWVGAYICYKHTNFNNK